MGLFDFLTNNQIAPGHVRVGENGECIPLTKGECRKSATGYEGDKKKKSTVGGSSNSDNSDNSIEINPASYLD